MFRMATDTADTSKTNRTIFWIAVAVLGLAFFAIEHDFFRPVLDGFALAADEMVDAAETGALKRQLGILAIAGLGLYLLFRKQGPSLHINPALAIPMTLYLAWCAASVMVGNRLRRDCQTGHGPAAYRLGRAGR